MRDSVTITTASILVSAQHHDFFSEYIIIVSPNDRCIHVVEFMGSNLLECTAKAIMCIH